MFRDKSNMVSVIMPLYNAESFLAQTIESVINQDYEEFELIIVDDGSMDDSLKIAQSYARMDSRISVLANDENRGIAFTRNRAIRYSKGEYIAILDDDDLMCEGRLSNQIRFLEAHPEIGAVGGAFQWVDEDGNIIFENHQVVKDYREQRMYLCFKNTINNSEMTFRRDVITKNNIFYEDGNYGMEDFHFWIRFSKVAKIVNIDDLVLIRRISKDSETAKLKRNALSKRAERFLELQILSCSLEGIEFDGYYTNLIRKYLAEEGELCRNYEEYSQFVCLVNEIISKFNKKRELIDYIKQWLYRLSELQFKNVAFCEKIRIEHDDLRDSVQGLNSYVGELLDGKKWLEEEFEKLLIENERLKGE